LASASGARWLPSSTLRDEREEPRSYALREAPWPCLLCVLCVNQPHDGRAKGSRVSLRRGRLVLVARKEALTQRSQRRPAIGASRGGVATPASNLIWRAAVSTCGSLRTRRELACPQPNALKPRRLANSKDPRPFRTDTKGCPTPRKCSKRRRYNAASESCHDRHRPDPPSPHLGV
jgi:hypothetical protein